MSRDLCPYARYQDQCRGCVQKCALSDGVVKQPQRTRRAASASLLPSSLETRTSPRCPRRCRHLWLAESTHQPPPLPISNPSSCLSAGAVRSRLACLHTLSTAQTQHLTTPRAPTDTKSLNCACVNCGASFSRGRTRHRMQRTKKRIAAVAPDVSRHRPPWSSTPTFLTSPVGAPRCYPHYKTPQPWPASRLSSDTARGIPTAANSAHVHLLAHAQ